jgi:hypothetical protein
VNSDDLDGRGDDVEGDHCSPSIAQGPEARADLVPRGADHGEVGELVTPVHDRPDETHSDVRGACCCDPVIEVPEVPIPSAEGE